MKRPKPKPTETQLVRTILDGLAARHIFAWRANSGAVTAEYKGKKRYVRFAGVDGLSDIIGILPDGRFLAIECKIAPNKLSVHQAVFLGNVAINGGVPIAAYSWEDVERALRNAMLPRPSKV